MADEAKIVHDLVKRSVKAKDFEDFDVTFGEDSTGDRAVWISFLLDPDYPTADSDIQRLSKLSDRVRSAFFKSGIDRIPYVRFLEKQRAAV